MIALCALQTAGCGPYPRDAVGTTERVSRSRIIRLGVVDGDAAVTGASRAFVSSLETRLHARTTASTGSAERVLGELREGRLDLVLGRFADDTPWRDEVALIEPLPGEPSKKGVPALRPVARNGENWWIMQLEAVTRDGRGGS